MKSYILLLTFLLASFISFSQPIIFISGLDSRKYDLSVKEQAKLLETNHQVIAFRFSDWEKATKVINKNPNCKVILFSKGCQFLLPIYNRLNDKSLIENNIFIVEPFGKSKKCVRGIRTLTKLGLPQKNVIVGPSKDRGKGVVKNPTKTPIGYSHWKSLKFVSKFI